MATKVRTNPKSGNSFVLGFSSKDQLNDVSDVSLLPSTCQRHQSTDDPSETHNYRIFCGTWNVGGVLPQDDINLEDWLETKHCVYDIYVIGFQEVVPLNAKSILGPERSGAAGKWNSLVGATLNWSRSSNSRMSLDLAKPALEKQKIYPTKEEICPAETHRQRQPEFVCLTSKQMVGVMLSVWVRGDLRRYIHHAAICCVGCGIMGCLGNKGSISVRFRLHQTSFCFVCCHLASGGKEGDEIYRNSDAANIFARTRFPSGPRGDLPRKILDHDRVLLLGDLNYRISLPEDKTRWLVETEDWATLLDNDQLRTEVCEGGAFDGWNEGVINFSPTYKYYPNSDIYYGCNQRKKGEKRRSPAWCDRILWHGTGLKLNRYDRSESRLSDHRPVRAIFTAEVDVKRKPTYLGSFLSDHFDVLASQDKSVLLNCKLVSRGRRSAMLRSESL